MRKLLFFLFVIGHSCYSQNQKDSSFKYDGIIKHMMVFKEVDKTKVFFPSTTGMYCMTTMTYKNWTALMIQMGYTYDGLTNGCDCYTKSLGGFNYQFIQKCPDKMISVYSQNEADSNLVIMSTITKEMYAKDPHRVNDNENCFDFEYSHEFVRVCRKPVKDHITAETVVFRIKSEK